MNGANLRGHGGTPRSLPLQDRPGLANRLRFSNGLFLKKQSPEHAFRLKLHKAPGQQKSPRKPSALCSGKLAPISTDELQSHEEVAHTYRKHIVDDMNQSNLHLFINAYNSRRDLDIERPMPAVPAVTLQCPALLVVGDNSPAVDAVVECNSKLDPTKTTLLKMADCGGLPQISQPAKLAEAFKYFVQGMGYMPSASMTRLMRSRTASGSSVTSQEGSRSRSHTGEGSRSRSHTGEGSRSRSHTGEGSRGRSHTDTRLDITPNSGDTAGPKAMELSS
uniref:N-myc downstream regulated 1 n=1 Tax=Ornithorhynchus anatinus TaxID=9258 RepID=A0A6I8N8N7_ORNAN